MKESLAYRLRTKRRLYENYVKNVTGDKCFTHCCV